MLFIDAAELMIIDAQSRQLSPKSILFYRQRIRAVDRLLGPKQITEVTTADIRLVLSKTRPSSARHCYVTLNRLFRFLINDEIISKNPMAKIQRPKVEQKVIDPISEGEIQICYRAAITGRGFMGLRDAVVFATLVSTGLRREELSNLRDTDVRLAQGVLLVRGKGRKERLVPIPRDLRKLLARYHIARDQTRAGSRNDCDRFFRNRNGGPVEPGVLTELIARIGQRVGVHLHPHRLRHTFATAFMANDGADILTLQAICGWSQISMAQRYAKPSIAKMQRSMDSFSPVSSLK